MIMNSMRRMCARSRIGSLMRPILHGPWRSGPGHVNVYFRFAPMMRYNSSETAKSNQTPLSGTDYIKHVAQQKPTEFGSKHPLRRASSSHNAEDMLRQHEEQKYASPGARTHKPATKQSDRSPYSFDYLLYKPIWTDAEVNAIVKRHRKPDTLADSIAYWSLWSLKELLDLACGYTTSKWGLNKFTEKGWLYRVTFLETVAGIPGFVGAMARHCKSLREMKRDNGWIHTLLEEAENERMHLLVCLDYLKPPSWFRGVVVTGQFVMFTMWGLTYFCSPKMMHRLVGYLEDEAVGTYLELLALIDNGKLPGFQKPAKELGRAYWQLPKDATIRDVFAQMCADEANHRMVNHTFADLTIKQLNTGVPQKNPFSDH